MPCISRSFDAKTGPLIQAVIVPAGQLPAPGGGLLQTDQLESFDLLIDTGADVTCISREVVKKLGLRPTGKRTAAGVTGENDMNTYMVDVVIPFGNTFMGPQGLQVVEFDNVHPKYQGLLGRDVVSRGHFSLSWNNTFVFCL